MEKYEDFPQPPLHGGVGAWRPVHGRKRASKKCGNTGCTRRKLQATSQEVWGDDAGCTRRSRSVRARGRGTREREGEMARERARDDERREMASYKRSAKIPREGSRMTRKMDK
jgi:hypothetical protein